MGSGLSFHSKRAAVSDNLGFFSKPCPPSPKHIHLTADVCHAAVHLADKEVHKVLLT